MASSSGVRRLTRFSCAPSWRICSAIPHAQVEVIVPFVGGAYGSKSYFKIEPLVVAMARKTDGRPVRIVQTVAESMLTTRRHSARVRLKTGIKRDGTLVARAAQVLMDTGAYADNGPRVAKRVISRMLGPYKLEHCKVDVLALYTNTVPAGSMRSIGGPQTIWALESHMDSIAAGSRHRSHRVSPAPSARARRGAEARRHAAGRRFAPGHPSGSRSASSRTAAASPSASRTPKRCRYRWPWCACSRMAV